MWAAAVELRGKVCLKLSAMAAGCWQHLQDCGIAEQSGYATVLQEASWVMSLMLPLCMATKLLQHLAAFVLCTSRLFCKEAAAKLMLSVLQLLLRLLSSYLCLEGPVHGSFLCMCSSEPCQHVLQLHTLPNSIPGSCLSKCYLSCLRLLP